MSHFEDFERTYGPPENCEKPTEEVIRQNEAALPKELLDHWREVGWCSYGKGLLWFVNPQQFEGVIDDWVEFEPGSALVFLRTAFAHLYLWHDGYVYSLDVQRGGLSQVTKDITRIFTLLCNPQMQEKILRVPLYEEAMKRLGPPDRDECYGFEPALALGGPGTVDTIKRVKIREHLGILAQLVG
ncbi:MAG: hypothetical protein QOF62_2392 [Pyrinomonadaceae bacterium]|jgi:hypothetical protein|nr:hypothetical protein [Pyrinomonadaceae bacterium]